MLLRRFAASSPIWATFLLPSAAEARQHATHGGQVPSHTSRKSNDSVKKKPAEARVPPKLIMLDPGHGGRDPGAIGVSGTYEKHIALAAALELKRQLEATGRYKVALTRERDLFIPLDDRVEKAERLKADLFVSMHADALLDHSVRGASIYTLGETASDDESAQLAQRENSADRFAGRHHGRAPSREVARVLANLRRQQTRAGSLQLSAYLVDTLGDQLPLLQNPERHAGFAVLKAWDIPSVLVEMGFMSNRRDEAALRKPEHRRLIAQAMRQAVDHYFLGPTHRA
jgi:N-acetylmuramoyl-L-alanine amidase